MCACVRACARVRACACVRACVCVCVCETLSFMSLSHISRVGCSVKVIASLETSLTFPRKSESSQTSDVINTPTRHRYKYDHVIIIFQELFRLNIRQRIYSRILLTIYKSHYDSPPGYPC